AEEVKKSNPTAKDVEVGKDGTTTVTFPDGSTAVIPADKAVVKAKDSEGVQNPSTPATDAGKNTPVAQNQTAKPANKSKDSEGVKAPSATSVKDPSNLTDAEKAKVAEEVKKSNPTATDVKVGKDGTTTVTFPDGSTAVIPADKAVAKAKDSEGVQDPSATAVKDPSNLTDADKAKAASNTSQATSAQANARKVAKELPNTGTADSTVAMVAAAASALLGLGLAGRRRKEDEEA
ncbi:gram positive anchor, partial [Streptococcus mitis SK616]